MYARYLIEYMYDLFDIHSIKQSWKDTENGHKWSWKVTENHFQCSVRALLVPAAYIRHSRTC